MTRAATTTTATAATTTNNKTKHHVNAVRNKSNVDVYGFFAWIASTVAAVAWFVWAYVPNEWLAKLDITYYPDKYWAAVVPLYTLACVAMAMLAYCLVDARDTLPLDSPHTIKDRFSLPEPSDANKQLPAGRQVPPIYDIAIESVNAKLYANPLALSEQLIASTPTLRRVK